MGFRSARNGQCVAEKSMKSLVKFFVWATCSVAVGAAFLFVPRTAEAAPVGFVFPESAVLLLLGVGLSAIAVRFRARRRS